MFKSLRIISVILIAVLYCYAISIFTSYSADRNSGYFKIKQNTEKIIFSTLVSNLLNHTLPTTYSKIDFNSKRTTTPENFTNDAIASHKITFQLYFDIGTPYLYQSLLILVNHRKTDLIFPFQYFW